MYTSMMRKALFGSGDTALLSLDFTAGTVPTDVTFTRADTTARATFIDSSGYVKTVASAGAARFDYVGGVAKGLLIEAAATNLCTYSNQFSNAEWTKDGAQTGGFDPTVDASYSATGPDGASTVSRIVFNKTNGAFSRIRRAVSVSNGAYIMSIWMKANTAAGAPSSQAVVLRMGSSAGVDCAVTTTWQRFTHTFTVGDLSAEFQIMLWDNVNAPAETADVLVYGAQTESGSTATSYIPTGASALTRLADDAVIRSTAWTSLYAQPGAMVVEFYRGAYGAGDRSVLTTDPTAARHWHLKQANASATAQIAFSSGSAVTQTGLVSGLNKVAIAWNAPTPTASFDLCVNGATPTFGGSNVGTTLSTWLTLGSQSTTDLSGTGVWDGYLNNSIKSVKYYSALTYAEMQAKTT
jgi:hypothetical protein